MQASYLTDLSFFYWSAKNLDPNAGLELIPPAPVHGASKKGILNVIYSLWINTPWLVAFDL